MPPHSLYASTSASHQTSYLVPSIPSSPPSLPHRSLLAQDMKKTRNAKQLSLKVSPPPGNYSINIHDSDDNAIMRNCDSNRNNNVSHTSLLMIATPSTPSFPRSSSTSLSSRRAFTPAPLSSASLSTPISSSCHTPSLSASIASSSTSSSVSSGAAAFVVGPTSKRHSQLLLDHALPTPRLPLPASTTCHRSISAYFSDYSLECGAASPYTSEPVCVLPNLYLGAEHNALDVRTLQRLGITFVLNVAIEIAQEESAAAASSLSSSTEGAAVSTKSADERIIREGVHYSSLAWTHHQKNLLRDFPTAFALIDEALARNNGTGKALVHCQLGVSRSASLVIAYVMRSHGMGLTEAYDFVKQRSGVISPNMSLMYQLAEYEKSLKNPGSGPGPAFDSVSDSASARSRNSWSSQMDDDEPPYPFSAAFSAAAATPAAAPAPSSSSSNNPFPSSAFNSMIDTAGNILPSTPVRQEFSKRPLTPDNGIEDHPNTKPFQSPSIRLANPKSFLSSRRGHLNLNQGSRPSLSPLSSSPLSSLSSTTTPRSPKISSYQRSLLTTSPSITSSSLARPESSMAMSMPMSLSQSPPKTPTADRFSSLNLDIDPSCHDVEMVPPTPLFQSSFSIPSLSSSSTSSSASSVSSFEALCCPRPSISSSSSSSGASSNSTSSYFTACDEEESQVTALKQKKKVNVLWTGLRALQVISEASSSSSSLAAGTNDSISAEQQQQPTASVSTAVPTTTTIATITTTPNATMSKAPKLPDFIFSPRPYTRTHHETRSFGDFYHALCMEG